MSKRLFGIYIFSGGFGNQLYQYANFNRTKRMYEHLMIIYPEISIKKHEVFMLERCLGPQVVVVKGWLGFLVSYLLRRLSFLIQKWCWVYSALYQVSPDECVIDEIRVSLFGQRKLARSSCATQRYVAIHVRLGDYLNRKERESIGLLPNVYYSKCLDLVANFGYPIYIVSDGHQDLVRQYYPVFKTFDVKFKALSDPMSDFKFLIEAEVLVLANSTFSAWAGYLGHRSLTLMPRSWFPAKPSDLAASQMRRLECWDLI